MENMREEFEAWRAGDNEVLHSKLLTMRYGDGYLYDNLNMEWNAWQASRAAQCVELPNWRDDGRGEAMYYESDITNMLDAAGIRYT